MEISHALFDIGRIDRLAQVKSPIHRIDPRAKLLVTLAFVVSVASFDAYAVAGLLPFFLYPASILALGDLPIGYLLRKMLLVAPFALLVGAANPWLEPDPLVFIGPFSLSAGWVSYASIMLRFTLTVLAALILIATTGFYQVCAALNRMGLPGIMTVQLLLAYRYLFVLIGEGARMVRARQVRTFKRRGQGFQPYISMLGHLLLRTIARSRRIHQAMLARGFTGEPQSMRRLHFTPWDGMYTALWLSLFLLFRLVNLPAWLGSLLTAG